MSGRHRPTSAVMIVFAAALTASACTGSTGSSSASDPATSSTIGESRPEPTRPDSTVAASTDAEPVDEPAVSAPVDAQYAPDPIEWVEFSDGVDTATVTVPMDYADPSGPQFELFVARHRALDPEQRIGSIFVNPGGPGRAGVDYAVAAPEIFDPELLERFDIVAWDPRGTGESTPFVDCIDDYDPYFTAVDSTPESDAEQAALVGQAQSFVAACEERSGAVVEHVGTNNSARDIDSIRRAIGEDQISFFGFSYGSELGATWATLFPDTVRAAVLDGGTDPNADSLESTKQQALGFEQALGSFFQQCADNPGCAFGHDGNPRQAFVELLDSLDATPLEVDPERPPVNRDVATTAAVQAMYSDAYWPAFERAIASAQFGDGAGLLELHDGYYRRRADGTYPNFLEAFQVISCADDAERFSVEEADAQVAELHEVAPTLIPADSAGSYFCSFFPEAVDPRVPITGDGAGPIVVIGTTGDPATPYASTAALADTLDDGRLVVVDADQHLGYGTNACVNELVNRYLVDLEIPAETTECT